MDLRPDPIDADDFRVFPRHLDGKARSRHHAEYAGWHRDACWNGRRFERFPEYIVRAQSIADVGHSIDFARRHGLSVSVRGRGHSYAGCFLRDNGLLLDLSALDRIDVDPAARMAAVQPGVSARQLAQALAPHGLAFPTGHGGDVGLSGFLLGGGLGINFRAWGGMSAFNLRALDLIGADGELLHADAEHHPQLFWAARGGGPGLGFVAVKFYLDCQPLPACITGSSAHTGLDRLGALLQAVERADPPPALQVMIAVVPHGDGLQAALSTLAFADTAQQAQALHAALFSRLPAGLVEPLARDQPSSFEAIYRQSEAMLVSRRYRCDNVLTDRGAEAARILAAHLPLRPSPASVPLLIWRGEPRLPDAAFSARGRWFVSTYAQWDAERDDEANRRWLKALYDELAGVASGAYINEFDLEERSAQVERCFAPANWARLRELRRRCDPDGVFHDVRIGRR
ncbi:FAD/FMN-containing dehydrogenase [Lysobacter sp. yr284]|uniref:FAD-binding oxidoreductase n=1 Tax=Lysobacter sp. yr284 TaxID=1761791 RepID=UPI00089A32D1|nr:FAD-binding oxidoreductase [Lysobacter sp. yr284]SDY80007.1 FAD/FMN-containing dehydrogenase [Lysobacter sp. yr284]